MKRVVVSVTNDLATDQRVHKVCTTLYENNFDILLIGRKLKDSLPIKRKYKTKRIRLLFNRGFLFYAEYNLRLFLLLLFTKKNILLSNDLDTLLANYFVSLFSKTKLVFDSHELFSELPSVQGRFSQHVWKKLESSLLPKLKNIFTVSDSISKWFKKEYGINSLVIKNFAKYESLNAIVSNENYIIYQGALNNGRGLIPLIKAMKFIDANLNLKIVGTGPIEAEILNEIKTQNLESRIELSGNIKPTELRSITQKAMLGVSLEEDFGLSYRYSLPNKLFDYIQARIPIVATYLPEIKTVVTNYCIGEIIENHKPKAIALAINSVISKGKLHYQNNLNKAAKKMSWEEQEEKILAVFNHI